MKKMICALFFFTLLLPTQGLAREKLVVASYGGVFDEAFMDGVVRRFEKTYDVDVVLDPSYRSVKLIAEQGKPSVDLMVIDDDRIIQFDKMGLLIKLDLEKIPNHKDLFPKAIDKTGCGIMIDWGCLGLTYRKDMIKTPPTSWNDLWDPKYTGKVALTPLTGAAGVQLLTMAGYLNGAKLENGRLDNMDKAWEKISELAKNSLAVAMNTPQVTDMLTRGDIWMVAWWDGRALALEDALKKAGTDVIGFVRPKEGAFTTINEMAIPVGSKKVDLAYKFIDMIIDPEAQSIMTQKIYYGPVNKKTVLPEDLQKRVVWGESVINSLIAVDWEYVAPLREVWMNKFEREISPLVGTNVK